MAASIHFFICLAGHRSSLSCLCARLVGLGRKLPYLSPSIGESASQAGRGGSHCGSKAGTPAKSRSAIDVRRLPTPPSPTYRPTRH